MSKKIFLPLAPLLTINVAVAMDVATDQVTPVQETRQEETRRETQAPLREEQQEQLIEGENAAPPAESDAPVADEQIAQTQNQEQQNSETQTEQQYKNLSKELVQQFSADVVCTEGIHYSIVEYVIQSALEENISQQIQDLIRPLSQRNSMDDGLKNLSQNFASFIDSASFEQCKALNSTMFNIINKLKDQKAGTESVFDQDKMKKLLDNAQSLSESISTQVMEEPAPVQSDEELQRQQLLAQQRAEEEAQKAAEEQEAEKRQAEQEAKEAALNLLAHSQYSKGKLGETMQDIEGDVKDNIQESHPQTIAEIIRDIKNAHASWIQKAGLVPSVQQTLQRAELIFSEEEYQAFLKLVDLGLIQQIRAIDIDTANHSTANSLFADTESTRAMTLILNLYIAFSKYEPIVEIGRTMHETQGKVFDDKALSGYILSFIQNIFSTKQNDQGYYDIESILKAFDSEGKILQHIQETIEECAERKISDDEQIAYRTQKYNPTMPNRASYPKLYQDKIVLDFSHRISNILSQEPVLVMGVPINKKNSTTNHEVKLSSAEYNKGIIQNIKQKTHVNFAELMHVLMRGSIALENISNLSGYRSADPERAVQRMSCSINLKDDTHGTLEITAYEYNVNDKQSVINFSLPCTLEEVTQSGKVSDENKMYKFKLDLAKFRSDESKDPYVSLKKETLPQEKIAIIKSMSNKNNEKKVGLFIADDVKSKQKLVSAARINESDPSPDGKHYISEDDINFISNEVDWVGEWANRVFKNIYTRANIKTSEDLMNSVRTEALEYRAVTIDNEYDFNQLFLNSSSGIQKKSFNQNAEKSINQFRNKLESQVTELSSHYAHLYAAEDAAVPFNVAVPDAKLREKIRKDLKLDIQDYQLVKFPSHSQESSFMSDPSVIVNNEIKDLVDIKMEGQYDVISSMNILLELVSSSSKYKRSKLSSLNVPKSSAIQDASNFIKECFDNSSVMSVSDMRNEIIQGIPKLEDDTKKAVKFIFNELYQYVPSNIKALTEQNLDEYTLYSIFYFWHFVDYINTAMSCSDQKLFDTHNILAHPTENGETNKKAALLVGAMKYADILKKSSKSDIQNYFNSIKIMQYGQQVSDILYLGGEHDEIESDAIVINSPDSNANVFKRSDIYHGDKLSTSGSNTIKDTLSTLNSNIGNKAYVLNNNSDYNVKVGYNTNEYSADSQDIMVTNNVDNLTGKAARNMAAKTVVTTKDALANAKSIDDFDFSSTNVYKNIFDKYSRLAMIKDGVGCIDELVFYFFVNKACEEAMAHWYREKNTHMSKAQRDILVSDIIANYSDMMIKHYNSNDNQYSGIGLLAENNSNIDSNRIGWIADKKLSIKQMCHLLASLAIGNVAQSFQACNTANPIDINTGKINSSELGVKDFGANETGLTAIDGKKLTRYNLFYEKLLADQGPQTLQLRDAWVKAFANSGIDTFDDKDSKFNIIYKKPGNTTKWTWQGPVVVPQLSTTYLFPTLSTLEDDTVKYSSGGAIPTQDNTNVTSLAKAKLFKPELLLALKAKFAYEGNKALLGQEIADRMYNKSTPKAILSVTDTTSNKVTLANMSTAGTAISDEEKQYHSLIANKLCSHINHIEAQKNIVDSIKKAIQDKININGYTTCSKDTAATITAEIEVLGEIVDERIATFSSVLQGTQISKPVYYELDSSMPASLIRKTVASNAFSDMIQYDTQNMSEKAKDVETNEQEETEAAIADYMSEYKKQYDYKDAQSFLSYIRNAGEGSTSQNTVSIKGIQATENTKNNAKLSNDFKDAINSIANIDDPQLKAKTIKWINPIFEKVYQIMHGEGWSIDHETPSIGALAKKIYTELMDDSKDHHLAELKADVGGNNDVKIDWGDVLNNGGAEENGLHAERGAHIQLSCIIPAIYHCVASIKSTIIENNTEVELKKKLVRLSHLFGIANDSDKNIAYIEGGNAYNTYDIMIGNDTISLPVKFTIQNLTGGGSAMHANVPAEIKKILTGGGRGARDQAITGIIGQTDDAVDVATISVAADRSIIRAELEDESKEIILNALNNFKHHINSSLFISTATQSEKIGDDFFTKDYQLFELINLLSLFDDSSIRSDQQMSTMEIALKAFLSFCKNIKNTAGTTLYDNLFYEYQLSEDNLFSSTTSWQEHKDFKKLCKLAHNILKDIKEQITHRKQFEMNNQDRLARNIHNILSSTLTDAQKTAMIQSIIVYDDHNLTTGYAGGAGVVAQGDDANSNGGYLIYNALNTLYNNNTTYESFKNALFGDDNAEMLFNKHNGDPNTHKFSTVKYFGYKAGQGFVLNDKSTYLPYDNAEEVYNILKNGTYEANATVDKYTLGRSLGQVYKFTKRDLDSLSESDETDINIMKKTVNIALQFNNITDYNSVVAETSQDNKHVRLYIESAEQDGAPSLAVLYCAPFAALGTYVTTTSTDTLDEGVTIAPDLRDEIEALSNKIGRELDSPRAIQADNAARAMSRIEDFDKIDLLYHTTQFNNLAKDTLLKYIDYICASLNRACTQENSPASPTQKGHMNIFLPLLQKLRDFLAEMKYSNDTDMEILNKLLIHILADKTTEEKQAMTLYGANGEKTVKNMLSVLLNLEEIKANDLMIFLQALSVAPEKFSYFYVESYDPSTASGPGSISFLSSSSHSIKDTEMRLNQYKQSLSKLDAYGNIPEIFASIRTYNDAVHPEQEGTNMTLSADVADIYKMHSVQKLQYQAKDRNEYITNTSTHDAVSKTLQVSEQDNILSSLNYDGNSSDEASKVNSYAKKIITSKGYEKHQSIPDMLKKEMSDKGKSIVDKANSNINANRNTSSTTDIKEIPLYAVEQLYNKYNVHVPSDIKKAKDAIIRYLSMPENEVSLATQATGTEYGLFLMSPDFAYRDIISNTQLKLIYKYKFTTEQMSEQNQREAENAYKSLYDGLLLFRGLKENYIMAINTLDKLKQAKEVLDETRPTSFIAPVQKEKEEIKSSDLDIFNQLKSANSKDSTAADSDEDTIFTQERDQNEYKKPIRIALKNMNYKDIIRSIEADNALSEIKKKLSTLSANKLISYDSLLNESIRALYENLEKSKATGDSTVDFVSTLQVLQEILLRISLGINTMHIRDYINQKYSISSADILKNIQSLSQIYSNQINELNFETDAVQKLLVTGKKLFLSHACNNLKRIQSLEKIIIEQIYDEESCLLSGFVKKSPERTHAVLSNISAIFAKNKVKNIQAIDSVNGDATKQIDQIDQFNELFSDKEATRNAFESLNEESYQQLVQLLLNTSTTDSDYVYTIQNISDLNNLINDARNTITELSGYASSPSLQEKFNVRDEHELTKKFTEMRNQLTLNNLKGKTVALKHDSKNHLGLEIVERKPVESIAEVDNIASKQSNGYTVLIGEKSSVASNDKVDMSSGNIARSKVENEESIEEDRKKTKLVTVGDNLRLDENKKVEIDDEDDEEANGEEKTTQEITKEITGKQEIYDEDEDTADEDLEEEQ